MHKIVKLLLLFTAALPLLLPCASTANAGDGEPVKIDPVTGAPINFHHSLFQSWMSTNSAMSVYAISAGYATNSGYASQALHSTNSDNATSAASATTAGYASQALHSTNSDNATSATSATTAGYASQALHSTNSDNATSATSATTAGYASQALHSTNSDNATSATSATTAANLGSGTGIPYLTAGAPATATSAQITNTIGVNVYDASGAAASSQTAAQTFASNATNITSGTLAAARVATSAGSASISAPGNTNLSASGMFNTYTVMLGPGSGTYTATLSILDAGAVTGSFYEINVSVPASTNPTLSVYDNSTGGTQLTTLTGSGTAGGTTLSYQFNGTSWVKYGKGAPLLINNLSDLPSTSTALANLRLQTNTTTIAANTTGTSRTPLSVALPIAPPTTYVLLGDSITAGTGATGPTGPIQQMAFSPLTGQGTTYVFGQGGAGPSTIFGNYSTTFTNYAWTSAYHTILAGAGQPSTSPHALSPAVAGGTGTLFINAGTNGYQGIEGTCSIADGSTSMTAYANNIGTGLSAVSVGFSVWAGARGQTLVGTVTAVNSGAGTATLSAGWPAGMGGTGIQIAFTAPLSGAGSMEAQYTTGMATVSADSWTHIYIETLIPNPTYTGAPSWEYFDGNRLAFNAWLVSTFGNGAYAANTSVLDTANIPELQYSNAKQSFYYSQITANLGHPSDLGYGDMYGWIFQQMALTTSSYTSFFAINAPGSTPDYSLWGNPLFSSINLGSYVGGVNDPGRASPFMINAYELTNNICAANFGENLANGQESWIATGNESTDNLQVDAHFGYHQAGTSSTNNSAFMQTGGNRLSTGGANIWTGTSSQTNDPGVAAFMVQNGLGTISGTGTLFGYALKANAITPNTPTGGPTGTAGSTTYVYKVVYGMADGTTTQASAPLTITTGNATLTTSNYNSIFWTYPTGAVKAWLYRTASGGSPSSTGLISGPLTPPSATVFDKALAGDSTTPPVANSTGVMTALTSFNASSSQTTTNGSTAGSVVISQPFQGASYKGVVVQWIGYCSTNAVTYTFPTPYTNVPDWEKMNSGADTWISSITTTNAVINATSGATNSGALKLIGY